MAYEVVIPFPVHQESIGGPKRVIQSIVQNSSEDFNFTILTPETSDKVKNEYFSEADFIEFEKRLPGWAIDYRRPAVHKKMEDFDLIWSNELMIADIVVKKSVPSAMTYHGLELKYYPGFPSSISLFKNKVQKYLMERGFRYLQYFDRVICVSKYARSQVERDGRARPVVIYNPSDHLGREFSEQDEEYVFIGDGADQAKIAKRIIERYDYKVKIKSKSGLDFDHDKIEKTGFVSEERLKELYKKCSFYVNTSFSDTFGITPIEANNFGKFSFVRDKECHRENIENWVNGYKALNTEDMLDKMEELIEDRERRRELSRKAFDQVEGKFTSENAVKQYEEEFKTLVR